MELQYLPFDFSDEESGSGSFDAMAAVEPARLDALLAEIGAVLAWAHASFGPPHEEGEWHFDLHAIEEPGRELAVEVDVRAGKLSLAPAGEAPLVTVTFTLTGSARFTEAFGAAFYTL